MSHTTRLRPATTLRTLPAVGVTVGALALTGCSSTPAPSLNDALNALNAANSQLAKCHPSKTKPCTAEFQAVIDALHKDLAALNALPDAANSHRVEISGIHDCDSAWQEISSGKADAFTVSDDQYLISSGGIALADALQKSTIR